VNPVAGLYSAVNKLGGLPPPAKAGLSLLCGGSLIGVAYMAFSGNKVAVLILTIGLVVVFGMLVLYKFILKLLSKRKSNPLSMGIAGNAAAAPQGISEPARRARLDDLRRNFEQGVEKFRAAGKNLYSVPWYVLVGEPGSGKTEAIRHCNVGFPPGLQDQLQGAGGTLNMNWWFTNQAIILDTAGRLMFEEVAPGSTNEWNEFLKLLKNNRPNCPINGMLLVIPVDTLIKDNSDSIEKKATKIAQQFDQIQRLLGVRFPVFIIISKCDLLNGFREFFDDLNDPQLQHQIMGWSNPAPLDERFDPSAVVNHLETVKQRLTERRQQLLLDPINTEDANGRRVDQVDALYALPDSITKIAPRLRRYLEMIFVAGEWSPKPLFLRGIYFTSSMTEGSALDAELADVLGVPVDSLPEGRVWRRDRAYFLRDLFIEKVFREKGLVTRADNADKQQRTRRTIVLTCGFLAVVILAVLTWFGSHQLENSIGIHRDFWVAAAGNDPSEEPIIAKKDYAYVPKAPFKIRGEDMTIAQFFGKNLKLVQDEIKIPIIFKPMVLFGGNVNKQRHDAYRAYFEATVLNPVYTAVRHKLPTLTDATWSDDATGALAQLMKLEYAADTKKLPDGEHPQVDIDPLFKVILRPADVEAFTKDEPGLQATADWIYSPEADGTKDWPAPALSPQDPDNLKVIDAGVTTTIAYWQRQATDGPGMANILAVRNALKDFRTAEDELFRLKTHAVEKVGPYNTFLQQWQTGLQQLSDARNRAVTAWAAASKGAPETVTLKNLYTDQIARISKNARDAYTMLMKLTPETVAVADSAKSDTASVLVADRQKLTAAITDLDNWKSGPAAEATLAEITALDNAYLATAKGTDDAQHRRFEVQAQLYELADAFLVKKPPVADATSVTPLSDTLNKIDSDVSTADGTVDKLLVQAVTGDRLEQAGKLADFTIDVGTRAQRYFLIKNAIDSMPSDPEKWADYITARSANVPPEHLARPPVPLIAFPDKTFPVKFAPDTVGAVTDVLNAVNRLANDPNGAKVLEAGNITALAASKRDNFSGYLALYVQYWKKDVFSEMHFAANHWSELSPALLNLRERTVRSSLEEYGNKAQEALKKVGANGDASDLATATILGQKKVFQDACSDVISHWSDFGDSYRQCRRAILAMEPRKFLDTYTVGESGGDDGYVAQYWENFTIECVHVLANDSRKDILGGLQELAKYERFPLAAAGDPKDDLSATDLVAARAALDKVVGSANTDATSGAKSIGAGTLTRDKDLDEQLDALRGTSLLHDKLEYLANLQRFMIALPPDAKPLTVSVSVIRDKLKDDDSIAIKYAYMFFMQGGKDLHEASFSGNAVDKADIEYAGADFALQFKDLPQGPIIQTETFNGPWSPFRLLLSPNVKSATREGTKWTVDYLVTDANKKVWSLWLQLDFKNEVPDLKDWPIPPPSPSAK
jgi:hypothetical protein